MASIFSDDKIHGPGFPGPATPLLLSCEDIEELERVNKDAMIAKQCLISFGFAFHVIIIRPPITFPVTVIDFRYIHPEKSSALNREDNLAWCFGILAGKPLLLHTIELNG
ncbi:MAG: hypothetical protein WEA56_12785 [Balneolaceae bacterium]